MESVCGPCGQDSGFGSDSARLRMVQMERQSGAGQYRLARPSQQPSITKNLRFVPFDVFLTSGRISLMTYATLPAANPPAANPPAANPPAANPPAANAPAANTSTSNAPAAYVPEDETTRDCSLSSLTADDLLNANGNASAAGGWPGLLGIPAPGRSSVRQALGVTVVRQPGRRGARDSRLQPLLFLQLNQPSVLLHTHTHTQRLELSLFDLTLKGAANDYRSLGE